MGTPKLLSASLNTLTGSDQGTGSITTYFSEGMAIATVTASSNYNFSPSLTIASASATSNPQVWFKMDEGTGTSITSSNGSYSGSFQAGSTALSWESGSYSSGSYSIFLDQSSDYVTPPIAIWPTSSATLFTCAFWARMRGDVAEMGEATVFFDGVNASNQTIYRLHYWSDGNIHFNCGNTGGTVDSLSYDWNSSVYDDSSQWHHWAFTKNVSTGQMRIYLDGNDVANSTGNTRTFDTTKTGGAKIGGRYANDFLWAGNVNDFAVWDAELSAADMSTLYNDGSGSNPGAISSSVLRVLYPFQEGAGSTCYDKSGNSRDGTITNSHWALADPTPQPRTFVKFPGDGSSYINCGHHPNFGTGSSSGPMSVSAWVRYNNDPPNYSAFVQVSNPDTSWDDGWGLFWVSNAFKFYIQHYSSNAAYFAADVNFAVKQWNHVVGTWDNSTIKIYVNGVEGTSDSYSGVMSTKSNNLIIGQGAGGYVTDATIDDVRIYAGTTLTQAEVTDLYNERAFQSDFGPGRLLTTKSELTVTGLTASQGYILDVSDNIVSYNGGNSCVPNSASFVGVPGTNPINVPTLVKTQGNGLNRTQTRAQKSPGMISNFSAQAIRSTTTTTTVPPTIQYFQRVWDIDNTQWCYYTKTSIDATPGTSETDPTNSGNIVSSSVVRILDIS
jgi:hypothetical protein